MVPTILCGGAGSRLWPVSRELHPKPFIRLTDGQSLLQKAWLRGAGLPDVSEVLTVTNRELFFKTRDEYREVLARVPSGLPSSFILEPFGRNTAPAIAAASQHVAETHGEDTLMLVLAADHLVADQAAFGGAVAQASRLARQGRIVTFGIQPKSPETGYGYIEAEGHRVVRFVEKPDLTRALEYVASGRYLWNSGMFCFSAGAMLRELEAHSPEMLDATRACLRRSSMAAGEGGAQVELDSETFAEVPEDSIDCAVMERSSNISVVPCNIGWSDIGSWDALADLTASDEHGNGVCGQALLHDVSNCYFQSNERMVGAVGVSNLIVVDTPDAILIADRSRSQDVKHLYVNLKATGHETHKVHRTVHRPWGAFTVLETAARFKIKRIVVKPGASLSLQMHHHRSEHWIVVSGVARVLNGEQELLVGTDESTYIPAGHRHRVENPGVIDLVMIEVQSGDYLGEDDIVRFDDAYGRCQ